MRYIFAGTPGFAAVQLKALIAAGLPPVAVLTQPDRPAGRGLGMKPSDVKLLAIANGIEVHEPLSLNTPESVALLRSLRPELVLVVAYGLLLPAPILELPRFGCVNIHASLLPRWRGAAPIQRAILAGDARSGVCLMRMEAGMDTGPVLDCREVPIGPAMNAAGLHDALASAAAEALPGWMAGLGAAAYEARQQDSAAATHAPKLSRAEAELDWSLPAIQLDRAVRAYNPWPVAWSRLGKDAVRIWSASAKAGRRGPPGKILEITSEGFTVACGKDELMVRELQWPGGKRIAAADAARGRALLDKSFG